MEEQPSSSSFSVFTLLIAHGDKNLQRHVLRFCWRKWNVLARSCKALHTLVAPLLADVEWWRATAKRELLPVLVAAKWDADMCTRALADFDPFFDAWPADMPARVTAKHGEKLSWIWDKHLIKVNDVSLQRIRAVEHHVWIRDWDMRRRWAWSWGKGKWSISHLWTAYQHDDEGGEWYGFNNGLEQACYIEKDGILRFMVQKSGHAFWRHSYQPSGTHQGLYFHGYCEGTPLNALVGAHEWRTE